MPVQFRRDEEPRVAGSLAASGDDAEGLREGLRVAGVPWAVWTAIASALLILVVRALQRPTIAADKLLHGDGSHWTDMWMPAVLTAFYGAIAGAAVAWRTSAKASIGGGGVMILTSGAVAVMLTTGAITAAASYPQGPPAMLWITLAALAVAALGAAAAFTRLTH